MDYFPSGQRRVDDDPNPPRIEAAIGRDGIGMATPDASSGGPSGLRDSPPGRPQAAELALEAYGLPIQEVPPTGPTATP